MEFQIANTKRLYNVHTEYAFETIYINFLSMFIMCCIQNSMTRL